MRSWPTPRLRASSVAAAVVLAFPGAAVAAPAGTTPAVPAAAAAPSGASGQDLATRASALADEVTARWAAQQLPDGRFPDPTGVGGGDYGTAMLGAAMLRRGVDRSDRALIRGGLDAILAQVTQPQGGAFELLALSRAYRYASARLPGSPAGADLWAAAQPVLAADLASRGPVGAYSATAKCASDTRCYNNLKLVSGLASLELLGTGLTATTPTALLADIGLKGRVLHRAGSRIPKEAGSDVTRVGSSTIGGGGLLSDPPRNPLAYHALSTMMLGELVEELGPDAPEAASAAFDRAARALLALAAPDGDATWFGRGQGQVWVPAVVADAAALGAERTKSGALRGRFLALAETSLARLRGVYGVGAAGLPLVPGALDGAVLARRGIDPYATTRGYNGLAVDSLDRAAAVLSRVKAEATRVPATRRGVTRSPSQGGLATITRGSLWAAIAARGRAPEDARYGSGLLALQHRDAAGNWAPIVPGRPYNPRPIETLTIKQDGSTLLAAGVIGRTITDGVRITGGWSSPGGERMLDPGTTFTWTMPDTRTLQVAFTAKRSRVVVANALFADDARVQDTPFGFQVVSANGSILQYTLGVAGRRLPLLRAQRRVGRSAYDSDLGLAQMRSTIRKGERVTLRIRVIADAPTPTGG